ncbi:hypothetical protein L3V83_06705, partial [Thiotrichales bacterium 19X7-9]|nr:hypothetical protein [Thiotrichales bacterium 19X7-9]
RAYLSISGKNFLPQESQITTIPTPRAKKATRVEITPSQLTLIPNHTQKLTVKNLTSNKAYLKEIDLPSLSGVLITNNCSDVDYLTSKGSCEIIFQSGKQIGSSSNTVGVYGKNFLSKEAHITAKSPHLPGKPTSIDLIPNQITLLPNQSKSIVINNQSRVATKGLSINIPTLDGVTVTNNTCGDELLGKTSCTIEFKANSDVVSKQSDSLLVTGNNFLSKQAQIDTNNPKIQLKKLTRVEITPNQLVLLPSQTREMTISNMTATTADIKELNIPDLSGVTITNNCGSEIAGLSSCTIEYKAAKKLPASAHGDVLIYGKNFLSEKAQVIAKAVNPPVIPTSVELNTNQVTLLPGESKKIVVTNRTRVKTEGLTVTLPELDGVSINNGCEGEVLAKSESCIIQLEANKKFPTQQANLQVSGDNFLAHSVEVNTKMLNPSHKPTSIEVSPSQLVLLPNQTKTITVTNRTPIQAQLKEIVLPSIEGVTITNNCSDNINGKSSCSITFQAGADINAHKDKLIVEGKNFLSQTSEVLTYSNTIQKGINISLSKHEFVTASNMDKQITVTVTNNSNVSLKDLKLIQTPNDNPKNPGNPILTINTNHTHDRHQCINKTYLSPGKSCEYILDYSPNVVSSAYYLNVKLSIQSSRLLSNTENLTINNYPTTIIYGNSNATKVLVDQHDNIYISHDQGPGGIYVYFSKQDTSTVTGSIKPAVIMNTINIYNFTIDQNGLVYIASKRGLFVYKPDPDNYDQYIQYSQLSTSMVLSVFVDQHGYIYSGNSTLLIYKPYKLNRKHYKLVTTLTDDDGILGNSIRSIVVDPFGKLYVGSSGGLAIFKPDSNSDNGYDFPKQLKSNNVYDIFVNTDGEIYTATGYFYAGVYYGSVNIYYNENRDYQTITTINPNSTAHSVFVDRDGNIYVGTQNIGLLIYNKNYALIETVTMNDGLPSNYIGSIFVKSRNIYLATGAPQTPVNGNSLSIFPKPN